MKILILLVFCLSVIGCSRRGERIRNIKDFDQDQLNVVNNKFDIDIVSLNLNTRSRRNIKPICRGIEGCLKICEYFDKAKCKQLSVDKVLVFWMNQISMYNQWEQARNDLNLIATRPEVSDFLSNVDKDNQVMEALFNLSTSANCPINDQPNILFSYSPYVSLYLGAPEEASAATGGADAGANAEAAKQAGADAGVDAGAAPKQAEVDAGAKNTIAANQAGVDALANAEAVKAQEALKLAKSETKAVRLSADNPNKEELDAAVAKEQAAVVAAKEAEAKVVVAREVLAAAEVKVVAAKKLAAKELRPETGIDFVLTPCRVYDSEKLELMDAQCAYDGQQEVAADEDGSQQDADIPQQQMLVSTKKKIIDGQVLYFNLPVFVGYIKKCFGFDTKTFSEMALEIENKKAFEMGDKVISKACSENSECIRLSYCAIGSELVWENLKSSVKRNAGCDYEGFSEMLP